MEVVVVTQDGRGLIIVVVVDLGSGWRRLGVGARTWNGMKGMVDRHGVLHLVSGGLWTPGEGMLTVAGSAGDCRGHRPCDLGLSGRRQLDLGLFSRLTDALGELLEFVEHAAEGNIDKIFTAEVSVSVVDLTSKTPFCISKTGPGMRAS